MRLTKIYFFFLFSLLILIISVITYSEEGCFHDKATSPNPNCACNALLSALSLLNIDINENELSTLLPLDKDGLTSMYDLIQASKQNGLQAKALKLTYEQLIKVDMPAIVHLNTQHFITLKEVKDDGIIVIDNNSKETFIPKEEFLTKYSGHSIVFDSKVKGIALSNKTLKQIKGAHCTCGGCTASNCNTGLCGGALSCSPSNCEGTCPGGGSCYFCPIRISQWCGGFSEQCNCNHNDCRCGAYCTTSSKPCGDAKEQIRCAGYGTWCGANCTCGQVEVCVNNSGYYPCGGERGGVCNKCCKDKCINECNPCCAYGYDVYCFPLCTCCSFPADCGCIN